MSVRMADIEARDRPRERLARLGASSLTDAELVALVLRSGGPGVSAVDLAQRLLKEHGGPAGIGRAPAEMLAGAHAMGGAKAGAVVAAFELGRRAALGEEPTPVTIRDSGDIAALVRRESMEGGRETAMVVVLNTANRLLKVERLTVGTDTRCLIDPRDVLRAVIRCGGAAFALAHNHPSGNSKPSAEDVACTERIRIAAELVGVRFIDHVIVTTRGWQSLLSESCHNPSIRSSP